MKMLFLIFLSFIPSLVLSQDVIAIEHGEAFKPERTDSLLLDLYRANDYVISFRIRFTDRNDERSDQFILTKKGDQLSAYNYVGKTNRLEALSLPAESTKLAWRTFVQNDLFTIRDEKDIPNFCLEKYQIYNSYTYEFRLFAGGKIKKLSYYNPEYYDNACYGMVERAKIINCVSVVSHVLNK